MIRAFTVHLRSLKIRLLVILVAVTFPSHLISQVSVFDSVMQWRNIGPFRGGRSLAVAAHSSQPSTFYFGATGGGVWKTTDAGSSWINVSDGYFAMSSVGALAVAQSDPNVIYAGMGEAEIRGNCASGDGVYRSTDAGSTWQHVGLEATQAIGAIAIDPRDENTVLVAALGHPFDANIERGVFRSTDGGRNWAQVLRIDDTTGAIDVQIDPLNPRIVFASTYCAYRRPFMMSSGGKRCGLWKSTDGGVSWTDISTNAGLPKGIKGKICMSVSAAQGGLVWAMIENENGGLFKSVDGGANWSRVSQDKNIRQRPWYFSRVYADPQNPDMVYVLNVGWFRSKDGGKSFQGMSSMHGDHHALWIDPHNPQRMILGDDGGASVSYNGGVNWSEQDIPTAQFYHVSLDNQFPYRVYGAQQDNSSVCIRSRAAGYSIGTRDWFPAAGGESGYVVSHPTKPWVIFGGNYGGYLERLDTRTEQGQDVSVHPENSIGAGAKDLRERFQWTYPIVFSPHNANTLYVTSQHVWKSTDEGMSWVKISNDLSRNDSTKLQPSGGPITKDNTGVEVYCTVFAFTESPVKAGVLWAGSDDGLIHVSTNAGQSWANVTPTTLPEWSLVSAIEASQFHEGTAYVAANRYKWGDFKPYLLKTTDFGKTWASINSGIPEGSFTRVIREDPNREGLLYCGTERGVYCSLNDGKSWESLQYNLPVTPIHDLAVHKRERDLVAATHGRAFWILDDLTPLQQLADSVMRNATLLLTASMHRIILFDEEAHLIRCEAGVSFEEILRLIVPRGFFLPVTPGTKIVTVGGAIANDVHGKNHHVAGTFGCHVNQLLLARSDGSQMLCSETENREMFHATIGGLGLTGLILWAEFRIVPISSPFIHQENIRFRHVDEYLEHSRESDKQFNYVVSWIDCTASGSHLGRGIFMGGNFASPHEQSLPRLRSERSTALPFDFPGYALNNLSVRLFNFMYYHKQWRERSAFLVHYEPFFYPLDAILQWNKMYGRRGFFQYQFVVPFESARDVLHEVLQQTARAGKASFLSVLKNFGTRTSPGMLSFPTSGVTLSMDFKNEGAVTLDLMNRLDAIIESAGARLYPAKDARMSAEHFQRAYPMWKEFANFIDPKFSSSFWRRVTRS